MTEPIKPQDIEFDTNKPDEVIEVFNDLIRKYWDGYLATFKQDEAVILIANKMNKPSRFLFENHYLDIEHLYRQAGWIVEFEKPGYNETFPATFTFRKK